MLYNEALENSGYFVHQPDIPSETVGNKNPSKQ